MDGIMTEIIQLISALSCLVFVYIMRTVNPEGRSDTTVAIIGTGFFVSLLIAAISSAIILTK